MNQICSEPIIGLSADITALPVLRHQSHICISTRLGASTSSGLFKVCMPGTSLQHRRLPVRCAYTSIEQSDYLHCASFPSHVADSSFKFSCARYFLYSVTSVSCPCSPLLCPCELSLTRHDSSVTYVLVSIMSAKSILEADGKAILNYHLTRAPVIKSTPLPASATHNPSPKLASIYFPEGASVSSVLDQAESTYPWLFARDARFVAKPDQLIKRRGKSGLLALNKTWPEAREWIEARAGKPQQVETIQGVLRQFLVEPFVPHPEGTEYYININSVREVSSSLHYVFIDAWSRVKTETLSSDHIHLFATHRSILQFVFCSSWRF